MFFYEVLCWIVLSSVRWHRKTSHAIGRKRGWETSSPRAYRSTDESAARIGISFNFASTDCGQANACFGKDWRRGAGVQGKSKWTAFFFSLSQIFPIPLLLSTVKIQLNHENNLQGAYFEAQLFRTTFSFLYNFELTAFILIVVQFMIWVFAETYVKEAAFLLWCQAYQAERIYVRNNWNRFSSKSNKIIFWLLQWRGKRNT